MGIIKAIHIFIFVGRPTPTILFVLIKMNEFPWRFLFEKDLEVKYYKGFFEQGVSVQRREGSLIEKEIYVK